MKPILVTLLAMLVTGCTGQSPTAPSSAAGPATDSDIRFGAEDKRAGSQKVMLYVVESDDGDIQEKGVVVGMTLSLVSVAPDATFHADEVTNRQGQAGFWIPSSITEILVTTGTCGAHAGETETFVPAEKLLELPLNAREGWIRVHETTPNGSCTLP